MSIVLCEPFAYMDLLPHCMCASCTVCMQVICSTHHIYMCMYFSLGHLYYTHCSMSIVTLAFCHFEN